MREISSPLDGFASPFGPQRGFNPLRIFANDEPGAWFEANDATTLFTDVAGTTPVTTPGDAVALQLDKSGRGNHRTQATTAARPLYALHPVGGVRNKLQYTEEFDNAAWLRTGTVVTSNDTEAPNGTVTATKLVETANAGSHYIEFKNIDAEAGEDYSASVYAKSAGDSRFIVLRSNQAGSDDWIVVDLFDGTITEQSTGQGNENVENVGDGWYRISMFFSSVATIVGMIVSLSDTSTPGTGTPSYTGDGTSGIFIWGAQLEEGSTATNYQRVGSFLDVSEEGKARRGRLWYNGTSHFMQTGTITPGTDKVQVFAGLRKLSDATSAIAEFSTNISVVDGAFVLFSAPAASDGYQFRSDGTLSAIANKLTGFAAPSTDILTGLGDISGDSAILRIDGVQEAINTGDQGTGNYLAHPIYFGARAGTSLFFNGYEDTSIIRLGPNLDDTTISKVESYVASKTPEPTL